MPKKNGTTQKGAVVKVTAAEPAKPRKRRTARPQKHKMSAAAWIGYILAGVVVGTGLAVFAVRYRLLSPRVIAGLVLVLGIGIAAWFLQPKKRDPRWALVGGGVAAIGASQFIFQTLAKPRNAASSGGLQELRERLAEAYGDDARSYDDDDDYDDDDYDD